MDLKFAEYIVALDEERSVTRAAEKMNISQSALSNFLIRHEKEKGMKIFIRYKNTLIPTEKGQRYINALRQMCTLKAYAYQRIRACCGQVTDIIRIGVTPSQGMKHLADVYPAFVKSCPSTKLDIREEYGPRLRELVAENEIDLFFCTLNEDETETEHWMTYKTHPIQLVATMHKYFAKDLAGSPDGSRYSVIECGQLQGIPVILHGEGTSMRYAQDKLFLKERFTPVVIAEGNNSRMIKTLVKRGLGVVFLPEHYVEEGDMEDVAAFHVDAMMSIYRGISVRRGHHLSEAEACLADLVWSCETRRGEAHGTAAD